MASTYAVLVDGETVLVVDCDVDGTTFDAALAETEATKLKAQASVAAVVVQSGAQFWVF